MSSTCNFFGYGLNPSFFHQGPFMFLVSSQLIDLDENEKRISIKVRNTKYGDLSSVEIKKFNSYREFKKSNDFEYFVNTLGKLKPENNEKCIKNYKEINPNSNDNAIYHNFSQFISILLQNKKILFVKYYLEREGDYSLVIRESNKVIISKEIKVISPSVYMFGADFSKDIILAPKRSKTVSVWLVYELIKESDEIFIDCHEINENCVEIPNNSLKLKVHKRTLTEKFKEKGKITFKFLFEIRALEKGLISCNVLVFGKKFKSLNLFVTNVEKNFDYLETRFKILAEDKGIKIKKERVVNFEIKKYAKHFYDYIFETKIQLSEIILHADKLLINEEKWEISDLKWLSAIKSKEIIKKTILIHFPLGINDLDEKDDRFIYLEQKYKLRKDGIWDIDSMKTFINKKKKRILRLLNFFEKFKNIDLEHLSYLQATDRINNSLMNIEKIFNEKNKNNSNELKGNYGFWDYEKCFTYVLKKKEKIYNGLNQFFNDFWLRDIGKNSKNWSFEQLHFFYFKKGKECFEKLQLLEDLEYGNYTLEGFWHTNCMVEKVKKIVNRISKNIKRVFSSSEISLYFKNSELITISEDFLKRNDLFYVITCCAITVNKARILLVEELIEFDLKEIKNNKKINLNEFVKIIDFYCNKKQKYLNSLKLVSFKTKIPDTFRISKISQIFYENIKIIYKNLKSVNIEIDQKIENISLDEDDEFLITFANNINQKTKNLISVQKLSLSVSKNFFNSNLPGIKYNLIKLDEHFQNLKGTKSTREKNKERLIITSEAQIDSLSTKSGKKHKRINLIGSFGLSSLRKFFLKIKLCSELQSLELRKTCATDKGLNNLCDSLSYLTKFDSLSIVGDRSIYSDGWKSIEKLIKKSKSLKSLKLWIPSHSTDNAIESIREGVKGNNNIENVELIFSKNERSKSIKNFEKFLTYHKINWKINKSIL